LRRLVAAYRGERLPTSSNALVSDLLSPSGDEALGILAIHRGLLRPCLPEEIIDEYATVLAHLKFTSPSDEIVR
jgi:hypothetical protein